MTDSHRRGVTRGYVRGLISAVVIVAFSIMLAAWSFIALATDGGPVSTPGISYGATVLPVLSCLVLLTGVLWSQSILLLRGRRSLSLTHLLLASIGGYLIWCLLGMAVGLSLHDTWLSPYSLSLAIALALAVLIAWSLLLRRVYTDRPAPQWPWEKRGEQEGPDWANTANDPWLRDDDDGRGMDPDGSDGSGGPEGSGGSDDGGPFRGDRS